jgi:quercetin dioxygenase-like cupin family protein
MISAQVPIPSGAVDLADMPSPAEVPCASGQGSSGFPSGSDPEPPDTLEIMSESTSPAVAPRIIPKPWGREIWYAHEDRYAGKILEVHKGHALSLQKHEKKQETMYLQAGRLLYHLNGTDFEMEPGQCITIRPGTFTGSRRSRTPRSWR